MFERQRLHYLSVLGIDNYMPRRVLRGAAHSHLLSDDQLQQPVVVALDSPAVDDVETKAVDIVGRDNILEEKSIAVSPNSLRDITEKALEEAIDYKSKSAQVLQPQADNSENSKVEFVLTVWRINENCLVVDSHQPGTALPTDRLLLNILRAIGYSLVQLPQSETLRWPLFTGKRFKDSSNNDAEEAQAMVQAYMAAQKAKNEPKYLLLMGESAFSYVLSDKKVFDRYQGKVISDEQWSSNIAVTPSLIAMLEEPLKKAMAWKALKQLQ